LQTLIFGGAAALSRHTRGSTEDGKQPLTWLALAFAAELITLVVLGRLGRGTLPAGAAVALPAAGLVAAMVFSVVLNGARYTKWTIGSALIAVLGVACSAPPISSSTSLGALSLCVALFCLPALTMVLKESLLRGDPQTRRLPMNIFAVACIASAAQLLVASPTMASTLGSVRSVGLGRILLHAACGSALRLALLWALQASSAVAVQFVHLLTLPVSVVLTGAFMSLRVIGGLGFVLVAASAATLLQAREHEAKSIAAATGTTSEAVLADVEAQADEAKWKAQQEAEAKRAEAYKANTAKKAAADEAKAQAAEAKKRAQLEVKEAKLDAEAAKAREQEEAKQRETAELARQAELEAKAAEAKRIAVVEETKRKAAAEQKRAEEEALKEAARLKEEMKVSMKSADTNATEKIIAKVQEAAKVAENEAEEAAQAQEAAAAAAEFARRAEEKQAAGIAAAEAVAKKAEEAEAAAQREADAAAKVVAEAQLAAEAWRAELAEVQASLDEAAKNAETADAAEAAEAQDTARLAEEAVEKIRALFKEREKALEKAATSEAAAKAFLIARRDSAIDAMEKLQEVVASAVEGAKTVGEASATAAAKALAMAERANAKAEIVQQEAKVAGKTLEEEYDVELLGLMWKPWMEKQVKLMTEVGDRAQAVKEKIEKLDD